ncbi:hypothetical protein EVAR_23059_1 [Eumeta japonica]|uniref:Uncharacterized protein n=1 Tax=Eumeta variegata TaxID=151549 RepID=A0A4C1VPD9_EUMVA|nr:hypothetical protein EVAR_23059_1 [Eumeta japonica]
MFAVTTLLRNNRIRLLADLRPQLLQRRTIGGAVLYEMINIARPAAGAPSKKTLNLSRYKRKKPTSSVRPEPKKNLRKGSRPSIYHIPYSFIQRGRDIGHCFNLGIISCRIWAGREAAATRRARGPARARLPSVHRYNPFVTADSEHRVADRLLRALSAFLNKEIQGFTRAGREVAASRSGTRNCPRVIGPSRPALTDDRTPDADCLVLP